MTDNKQFSISLEYILLLGALALSYAGTHFFPGISVLLVVVSAAIVTAIGMRFSLPMCTFAVLALLVGNGIVSFLNGGGIAGCADLSVVIPAISGFLCAFSLRQRYSLLKTTVLTATGVLVGVGLFALAVTRFTDPDFFVRIFEAVRATIYEMVDALAEQSGFDENTAAQLKSLYVTVVEMLVPSVLIISCAAVAFLFPYLAKFYVRKRGDMQYEYQTLFVHIRADKVSALVPVVCLALIMFLQSQILLIVFFNMLLVMMCGMFVCGLAVVSYYLKMYIKGFPVRLLVFFFLFSLPSAPMLLAVLGIIDAFADLRRLKKGGGLVG